MVERTSKKRYSIFVDGNNMFYAQQKNGWFFDPRKILEYFAQEEEGANKLANSFWYTGIKDANDQRSFRDALLSLGFTIRTKVLKEYFDDAAGKLTQKANLDIDIVVDMFSTVKLYDSIILLSGDGDFERALEILRGQGKEIIVVSTDGMIAREARNVADRYIDLNSIREHIEKEQR